jgi:hypothetical protein
MVTTKEAINVLSYSENYVIRSIQLLSAGFVRGYLMNDIDWRRPCRVIGHPSAENDSTSIRIWMTSVVETDGSRAIRRALKHATAWLNYGRTGIDCRGAVSFRFKEDVDLSLPRLVTLIEKMTAFLCLFELRVTFYTMVDSGIHGTIVRQTVSRFYEWEDKPAKLFGGAL